MATAAVSFGLLMAGVGFNSVAAAQKDSHPGKNTLEGEVRHQLRMLNYYTVFDKLKYGVDVSSVILEGVVTNPELKR
jgi:hypothetical protein